MPRLAVAAAAVLAAGLALPASAEFAVLANGSVVRVESRRVSGAQVVLALPGGGEIWAEPEWIRAFVPDELAPQIGGEDDLRALVTQVARRYGLDPSLVLSVASVESGLRPEAVSPKGAQGLMQLMPATAAELGVSDAFDPAQNVDGGARHLRRLLDRFGQDIELSLAAYNAGEGAVARHGGVPPYPETRGYVRKVIERCREQSR